MLYIAHIWASLVSQTVKKLQYRGPGFDPWVGNIPWMRKWLPTPVLLPGDSHGQRSLVGYSPWSCQKSDMTEWLSTHTTHNLTSLLNNWRLIPLNDPPYFAYHLMPLPSGYHLFLLCIFESVFISFCLVVFFRIPYISEVVWDLSFSA